MTETSAAPPTDAGSTARGLPGLLLGVRDNWLAALIGAIVVLVLAGFLILSQKPEYTSQAIVGLLPTRPQSDVFVRSLAQQLPPYLTSNEVTDQVGQELGIPGVDVRKATSVEIPPATFNLTITSVYGDADTAAAMANAIADVALKDTEYKEFFTPVSISPATPAPQPSGLGKSVLIPLALLLAAIVGVVVALVVRDLKSATAASADPPTA